LEDAHRVGRTFDLVVVDPPSYSTDRAGNRDFDITRDHPRLLSAALNVMRPGGTLFFSTNHQGFEPRLEKVAFSHAEEITGITIPEDYRCKHKTIHRCWRLET
jgi:23S rRNA (cytosine1962-C5)-methyltransferase